MDPLQILVGQVANLSIVRRDKLLTCPTTALILIFFILTACAPSPPAPTPIPTPLPTITPISAITLEPNATATLEQPETSTPEPIPQATATQLPASSETITLKNVAAEIGLDFEHGAFKTSLAKDPIGMMGGGLCWLDVDNDGWLDLYVVNSHALHEVSDWEAQGGLPHNALFHNQGDGTFQDISQASQTDLALRGNGCVAADFNQDGWWDLYITADGPNALLWNNGDGTFSEGAVQAGVAADEWNSAAAVGDLNDDGWPDLFVAAYIDLANQIPKPSGAFPQDFYGLPDHLYLSNGPETSGGPVTFREITSVAGLDKEDRGLGALFSDIDQDGDLDLYIANDGHPNRLYINEPQANDPEGLGFRLIDMTVSADVGDSGSGMGIAGGDYDGDGLVDLFVTNWQVELNALYRNETSQANNPAFQYSTYRIGISGLGNNKTGWGTAWVDLDHDTDLDLLIANGRVPMTDMEADAQLIRLYRNRTIQPNGDGRPGQFIEWTQQIGLTDVGPLMARGSAVADYDNDGDLDIAINTIANPLVLLQNSGPQNNWLQVQFDGFFPGAMVKAELPDGRQLTRELYAGSSYLSSEDPRLHFGLGEAKRVVSLDVYWPDGFQTTLSDVPANQLVQITLTDEEKGMMQNRCKTLNIAHRGARSLAPENTILAAQKGLETGADMWELDVAMTADGVLYLVHDDTLERTSNVTEIFPDRAPWNTHDFTFAEIQQLDFGSWFNQTDPFGQIAAGQVSEADQASFVGLSAPTLEEALAFTRDHNWRVNVEIKDSSGTSGDVDIVEKVVALIEMMGMVDQVVISSFNHSYVQRAQAANPDIELAALFYRSVPNTIAALERLGVQAYNPSDNIIEPEAIPNLRSEGIEVNIYTVNDEARMRALVEALASGIFTDFPQTLTQVLQDCK